MWSIVMHGSCQDLHLELSVIVWSIVKHKTHSLVTSPVIYCWTWWFPVTATSCDLLFDKQKNLRLALVSLLLLSVQESSSCLIYWKIRCRSGAYLKSRTHVQDIANLKYIDIVLQVVWICKSGQIIGWSLLKVVPTGESPQTTHYSSS